MAKSKKTKKSGNEGPAQVEGHEAIKSEEDVQSTIVESDMEEFFAGQTEAGQETATEQPATVKPPKVSKRPYIADVEILLNAGTHTKPQILALIMEKYPQVSKGGASTFLTDLMNEKYRHWRQRAVVKTPEGKLQFADKLEAPEPEAQPTDEPLDKPSE